MLLSKKAYALLFAATDPSSSFKTFLYSFFICAPLAIYGGITNFSPSKNWQNYATVISVIFVVLLSSPFLCHLFNGKFTLNKNKEIWTPFIVIGFIFIYFITIRVTFVHSLGDIFTRLTGNKQVVTALVHKHIPRTRKECEYQIRGDIFSSSLNERFCISETLYKSIPDSSEVILKIIRSPFGDHIYGLDTNR